MSIVQIGNIEIYFEVIHPRNVRREDLVIIFLHEALGSIGQWKTFPQMLCDELGLKGVVYERQGHGKSSALHVERNSHYLHDYAWAELPLVIDKLVQVHQKALLVGHSDGGTIALLYTTRHQSGIAGCVTIAAHVINEPATRAGIPPAIRAFESGKLKGLEKYHGEKTTKLFYNWANTWLKPEFGSWNITEEIQQDKVPVLALQGDKDQYGTVKQLELIRENVACCQTEMINDCGHHPHLEKSSEVIERIASWIINLVTL